VSIIANPHRKFPTARQRSGQPGALRSVGLGPSLGGHLASRIAEQPVAHYAVLRRPRTPADQLPVGSRAMALGNTTQFDANPALARRVGGGGQARFWLVPGERSVCVVEASRGNRGGSVGCGSTDQAGLCNGHQPMGSTSYAAIGPRGHARRGLRVFCCFPMGPATRVCCAMAAPCASWRSTRTGWSSSPATADGSAGGHRTGRATQ
jgi:hypothetical protein